MAGYLQHFLRSSYGHSFDICAKEEKVIQHWHLLVIIWGAKILNEGYTSFSKKLNYNLDYKIGRVLAIFLKMILWSLIDICAKEGKVIQ